MSPEAFTLLLQRLTPAQLARVLKPPPVKPPTPQQQERARLADEYRAALERQQLEQE
jgi:hypothetical protein